MSDKKTLKGYAPKLYKTARKIKGLFFDVDGVLTDGKVIYTDGGEEIKNFCVRDGYIIEHLKRAEIIVGIISGRASETVNRRASELKLDFCHQAIVDKYAVFEKILEEYSLKKNDVAYIGDDINDLPILKKCGLSACPSDAPVYLKQHVDIVAHARGGGGVVREIADFILDARGILSSLLK